MSIQGSQKIIGKQERKKYPISIAKGKNPAVLIVTGSNINKNNIKYYVTRTMWDLNWGQCL